MLALLITFIFADLDSDDYNNFDPVHSGTESEDCIDISTAPAGGIDASTTSKYEKCGYYATSSTKKYEITLTGTTIGNYAFFRCNIITSVTLPDGLSSIGVGAFAYCEYLTSIKNNKFPTSLSSIGDGAFYRSSMRTIPSVIPTSLQSIGFVAFAKCNSLSTSLTIAGRTSTSYSLTINNGAFYNTSINIAISRNSKINKIGNRAFTSTGVSGNLNFPDTLTLIGEEAFKNCQKFDSVTFEKNQYSLTISQDAFAGVTITSLKLEGSKIQANSFEDATITTAVIINSIIYGEAFLRAEIDTLTVKETSDRISDYINEAIQGNAFSACQIKKSINLTDVIKIGNNAFAGLSKKSSPKLTFDHDSSTFISSGSLSIGSSAFFDTTIQLTDPSFNYNSIGREAFAKCDGVSGSLYLNVPSIGDYAFYYCNIDQVTLDKDTGNLPSTTDSQGKSVCHLFEGCDIRSFDIKNYTHDIPTRLFYGMFNLNSALVISSDVHQIGEEAFAGCNLKSLTIEVNPASSLTIGKRAFYKCKNMQAKNLYLLRNIQSIEEFAFYQCEGIQGVTFSSSTTSIDAYAFAQTGLTKLELPRVLSSLGEGAFSGCKNLAGKLDIPNTLTSIPNYAFYECPFTGGKFTSEIDLESIGEYAFYRCKFSGKLIAPKISLIDNYAFYECENLEGLELNDLYTVDPAPTASSFSIRDSAFQGCTGLAGSLPIKYCKSIGTNAFHGCSKLTGGLEFHDDITTINDYAFFGCSELNGEVKFSSGLQYINQYAFCGCSKLDSELSFPTSLISIGDHAFENCVNVHGPLAFHSSGISNDPNIYSIGSYAFSGCTKLNGPLYFDRIYFVGSHAFAGCTGFSGPLSFGTNLRKIGSSAFEGCSGFSESLSFEIGTSLLEICRHAFKDCTGFKDGMLFFNVADTERATTNYIYSFEQSLKIQNEAFENTKFKNIYYNGRFEPDCDLDIGINGNKGIKTSSHYANKTFCGNPLHKNKLSGGAIAGIVIACIVVVAIIVVVIVLLILKNKKNKDKSEAEVEMNQDP